MPNKILSQKWWRQEDSNRRPVACDATALPTELYPHESKLYIPIIMKQRNEKASHYAQRHTGLLSIIKIKFQELRLENLSACGCVWANTPRKPKWLHTTNTLHSGASHSHTHWLE